MEPFGASASATAGVVIVVVIIVRCGRRRGAIRATPRGRRTAYSLVAGFEFDVVGLAFEFRGCGRDLAVVMRDRVRGAIACQSVGAGGEGASDGFILDHNNHPDADFVVGSEEGRTRYVPRSSAFPIASLVGTRVPIWIPTVSTSRSTGEGVVGNGASLRKPGDFCRDAFSVFKGVGEAGPDVRRAADTGEEGSLEQPWDAKSGRDKDDSEGGVWTEEEVLAQAVSYMVEDRTKQDQN